MPDAPARLLLPLLRHEVCYRSAGYGANAAMLGAGFMLKPGCHVDVRESRAAHYSAVYVLRGHGVYRDHTGREFNLVPGSVFQRFPDLPHTLLLEPESHWAECFVACDAATQTALARFGFPNPQTPVITPGLTVRLADRVDRLLKDLQQATTRDLYALLPPAFDLLLDLCRPGASAGERPDETARLVATMCQILGRDLDNRDTVPELVQGLSTGYECLRKHFRSRLGISPTAYRIRCRVDAARALLSAPDMRIKEVAFRLGYPNAYAFSAQFKHVTGCSPQQFRQGQRSEVNAAGKR